MITLFTGAPGTGKTAGAVSLMAELAKGRTIYASGIPDLKIPHEELDDPTKWPEVVPDGSIIIIDEVQRVWRPRGPGQKVPPDIAALETHRHRGLDFYVITQSPRLMDSNIRGLVGRHVHIRDLGILGRFWYEWPECADNCSTGWKNAPIKKRYRLPKVAFSLYKSASVHIKPIRSLPWMLLVMIVALLAVAYLTWRSYGAISGKLQPEVKASPVVAKGGIDSITNRHNSAPEPIPVYDTTSFIPRLSSRPESAPAFDTIRQVVSMPILAGGMCNAQKCVCLTQQGTNAGLSDTECREWMRNTPFNPYKKDPSPLTGGNLSRYEQPPANPMTQVPLSSTGSNDAAIISSMRAVQ